MFFLEVGYKIKKKRRGGMSMRKKMKLFIAMVSVGVLLGTIPVMAAEQPELPTKVQDIANGSDDLYGEGVPIEHGTNPDERFSSGGVDHTHQYIVANALKILSNDQGNSAFNGELNSSILMEATDWPDKLGNETDAGTFAGHFYDPDSGKNWLGQTSPTARTRAESYFQAAVNAYRAGDVQLAMSNLGKGTHYVSDLNEPHHASNLTAVNSNHSAFEKYVDKNRKSYTIAGNSFNSSVYTTALNTSTGDLCNFGNCFGMCDAGIGNFKIFPNGQIYPCGFLTSNEKYCIGNIKEGVDIRKAKLIAMSNFDKTDPKCKGCTIRDFCHGMKCGYMNFINTGKINVPSDAECIFEHIFYKAMVQILEYYLQQPIEIVREKLGVYIDYIQEEDLKFSEFGEKIAKRLGDER